MMEKEQPPPGKNSNPSDQSSNKFQMTVTVAKNDPITNINSAKSMLESVTSVATVKIPEKLDGQSVAATGVPDASIMVIKEPDITVTVKGGTTIVKENEQSPGAKSAPPVSTDKLDSIGSEVSIGFGELINDLEDRAQALVIRDGPESYKTILRTVCAYAIRCSHGRLPIQKLQSHNGYWFPYAYANENEKYSRTVDQIYETFLADAKRADEQNKTLNGGGNKSTSSSGGGGGGGPRSAKSIDSGAILDKRKDGNKFLTNIQLYNIYRFQIPDGQFISRYIFLAQWNNNDPKLNCCKDSPNIQWIELEQIIQDAKVHGVSPKKLIDKLWGEEVTSVAPVLQQQHLGKASNFKYPNILEYTSNEVLKYTSQQNRGQSPSRTPSSNLIALLNEAKISERDVIKLYCDYVQHCFPAVNMTFCSFSEYCQKIGFLNQDEASLKNIYRSICFKNKTIMHFNEFLFGLVALETNAPNSQTRCNYIFRYYDLNSDNFLDEDDFRRMICDIREKSNFSIDPNEVDQDVKTKLSQLKLLDGKRRISHEAFMREVLSGRLSGTTHLFRASKPILETIHTRHLYEYILNKSGRPFATRLMGTCPKCKPKNYSLAYHAVKLNSQGRIDESKPLIHSNCGEIDVELQFKKKTNEMEVKHSIEIVFNENSVANRVLSIVRKMVDFNKLPREKKSEISQFVVANLTVDIIIQLCKEATEIFLIEPRVLKVNTPCLVMGDLHGNINDLLTYEEQLWALAPTSNAPNVLFLGDYVDRGDYSIEVISYLFAMKILAPTKFFLLRGNHEIRAIQRNFTFARECMLKYYYQNGQRVFEEFNSAFDHLPLVGIIDESIFCAHGGIPFSVNKIEELYKIPMPLSDPESQSKAAWEILWSDPVTDEEYTQVCQFKNQTIDNGYTDNLRRSTAYYFAEKALRNFLKANSLSHVIRAHELEAEGYRFHHSGLLITVFSSSRYCNSNNKSAAVFVNSRENDGFIKVIALET